MASLTAKQKLVYEVRLRDLASKALRNFGAKVEQSTRSARTAFKRLASVTKMAGLAVVAAFSAAAFKGLLD